MSEQLAQARLQKERRTLQRERCKRQQAPEKERCLTDATYFITTYCQIESDAGGGLVPFALYDYQTDLLAHFRVHRAIIILKARQLGITELVCAYCVWRCLTPHFTAIVISQDDDAAKEFVRRCRVIWAALPVWLQVKQRNAQATTTLELANGSRILPKPATGHAGRSFTAQLLVLDEWAQQEQADDIFAAAQPIMDSSGGQTIGISTARGVGNLFYEQWTRASNGTGMHPVFLPWSARPGRDAAWYERAVQTYAARPWMVAQELPTTAEEAFVLSGRPRFAIDAIAAIARTSVQAPVAVKDLGTDADGRAAGFLRVWEEPQPGRRYVVGADTAEGLPKGDYSTAVVLDWETGIEVAEIHGHWAPEVYAHYLADLCGAYSSAYLGVELNNHGHAVMLALRSIEHYPDAWIYQHQEYDALRQGKFGWQTTSKSKPIMIDALAAAITERRGYRNALFLTEARTYTIKDNGDTAASGSLHDDRVISYAIACSLRKAPWPMADAAPVGSLRAPSKFKGKF